MFNQNFSQVSFSRVVVVSGSLLLSTVMSVPVFAHSKGACVDNVVEGCNAQHPNNYKARLACVNSGITQCNSHSHGGGNGVDSASEDLTSGGNDNETRFQNRRIFKRLQLKP